ncbi:hypothetical protein GQ44DRAFT_780870 [Phaeosphaeriaceae sp. PMI808]|nr:hypothetical protein GQ44DRAFT_780870 [Phaeosphaeriaceae sp. PMI808]
MHTTPDIPRPPKVVSETKQDRDVFRLYGAAFRDIVHLDHTSALGHHVPVAAKDLWLGNLSFPREILVCERVLGINPARITASEEAAVVIDDLAQSEFADRSYVQDGLVRFYVGVALTSPRGAIVGALSIIDSKPRVGMPREDILYLQDLAATVMEHLDTYTLKDQQSRGERLTRGLISFAEGASALQPYHDDHRARTTLQLFPDKPTFAALQCLEASENAPALRLDDDYNLSRPPLSSGPPVDSTLAAQDPDAPSSKPDADNAIRALQESILPANSKAMRARAANIMRASSDLDGVLILDASVASGHRKLGNDTESSPATQSSSTNSGQRCQILGFSTRETSSVAENIWALRNRSLLEADLKRMLSLFPLGNILHFTADGEVISSSDDSESSTSTISPDSGSWPASRQRRGRGIDRSQKVLSAIQATLPGARSVAFVPFWDFERSRWFAGCLCWTKKPDRLLSPKLDLLFFKVFGHSVMNELSRLDTIASDQHVDRPFSILLIMFWIIPKSMNQVNEPSQNVSSRRLKGTKTVCVSSKALKTHRPNIPAAQHPGVDLGLAIEEVVEAVFAGQSYQAISDMLDDGTISPLESEFGDQDSMFPPMLAKRKSCFIILDIEEQDWSFCLPIGAWRRILMNIFGNALKFTQSGHTEGCKK